MGLNLDATPEELQMFLVEVDEHLQNLENGLLNLEKETDNEDLLQEIFRSSHTLKGSSATIGHNRMAKLTHAMENILDKLRKHQLTVTGVLINEMFDCLDYLKVLKDEILDDHESDLDIDVMIGKLETIMEENISPNLRLPEQAVLPKIGAKTDLMGLSRAEREVLCQGIEQGLSAFVIWILFEVEPELLAARTFVTLKAIAEMGEIIKSNPSEEEIEKEHVKESIILLLLSKHSESDIKNLFIQLPSIVDYEIQLYDFDLNKQVLTPEQPRTDKVPAKELPPNNNANLQIANKNPKKANRTVRVDVDLLDGLMNLVGELVIDRTRLLQVTGELESFNEMHDLSQDLGRTSLHIARITTQLQELIMKARMLPVENLFNKFPRMVRDLSHKAGKEIDFIMTGQETELDRSIIEEIGDPLIHLLRNAVDHGIELPEEREAKGKPQEGQLKLEAAHEENQIVITLRDDGKGISPETIRASAVQKGLITEEQARRLSDKEAVNLIFISGLSTNAKVTDVSGRGVGMDVVKTNIEKINGSVEINSVVDQGTEFKIKLPLTLAIIRALLVSIGESVYAVPLSNVTETIRIRRSQIEYVNSRKVIELRGKVLPLIKPHSFLNKNTVIDETNEKLFVVVINYAGQNVGLIVDSLIGELEIVIKSLGKYAGNATGVAGATILGDGNVAIILDIAGLIQKLIQQQQKKEGKNNGNYSDCG